MSHVPKLLLHESNGQGVLCLIEKVSTPHAGVWWCDGATLVAVVDRTPAPSASGRLDSDLAHADLWPLVASHFGRRADSEYFEVPRGRVLLSREVAEGGVEGVVIGGSTTTKTQAAAIARAFGLTTWRYERDEHYEVGDNADAVFDAW